MLAVARLLLGCRLLSVTRLLLRLSIARLRLLTVARLLLRLSVTGMLRRRRFLVLAAGTIGEGKETNHQDMGCGRSHEKFSWGCAAQRR